jgi:hypothetical protein
MILRVPKYISSGSRGSITKIADSSDLIRRFKKKTGFSAGALLAVGMRLKIGLRSGLSAKTGAAMAV